MVNPTYRALIGFPTGELAFIELKGRPVWIAEEKKNLRWEQPLRGLAVWSTQEAWVLRGSLASVMKRCKNITVNNYYWLFSRFLTYCPSKRISSDEALKHEYFRESPLPIDSSMFPTWPAKSEQQRVKRGTSPRPPEGGLGYSHLVRALGLTFLHYTQLPGFLNAACVK